MMPDDDDDERAGRAADLHVRAAERRDDEAGDDRAVDAGLRRHARRDRERHRQRQRDQADGDAGDQIGDEQLWRVVGEAREPTRAETGESRHVCAAMRSAVSAPICYKGGSQPRHAHTR